jgi:hypothetical protein
MRSLSSFDSFFLSDDKKCIVSGGITFNSNFEFEKMSDIWKNKFALAIPGAACRLVQIFGKNYWLNLSREELDEYWTRCCVKVDGIHTQEQAMDFLAKKADEKYDLYEPVLPYQFFMIPDYQDGRGLMMFVITHSFIDGVSFASSLECMRDKPDLTVIGK